MHTCALACPWRPEYNCGESVLTFYHVGLWDCAQVIRPRGRCPYPLSRSAGPHKFLLSKDSPRATLARVAWCLLHARFCSEYFPRTNCCPPRELRWWRTGQAPAFAELLCGIWHQRPGHLLSGSVLSTPAGHRSSPGKKGGSSVTEALRGGDTHALTPGRRGDLMPAFSE